MKYRFLLLALGFSLQNFALRAADTITPLVVKREVRCALVVPNDDALSKRPAEKLVNYWQEQAGAKPAIRSEVDLEKNADQTLIVLDGTADHHLLSKLGIKLDVPSDRSDAYHVSVVPQKQCTVIAVAGHTPSGAKFGAYRLMEEMNLQRGEASLAQLDLTASPFFKTRSVSLFNIWRVPVDIIRQCNLESWPAEKIQANVEMYDAFGFNALETHDRFHEDFLKAVYGLTHDQWREKVWAMCDRAHEDGHDGFLTAVGKFRRAAREGTQGRLHPV